MKIWRSSVGTGFGGSALARLLGGGGQGFIADSGSGPWNHRRCHRIEKDPVSASLQFGNEEGT